MDPMLFSQAHKLRAEMLAENAPPPRPKRSWAKTLLYWLGNLLLVLGHKIQGSMPETPAYLNRVGFAPLEDEMCV